MPQPQLHQVLPPLLTCVVSSPLGGGDGPDHWTLRNSAAEVVARVCRTYDCYPTLQTRVTGTLVAALMDATRPLATHYGAVAALAALGVHAIYHTLVIGGQAKAYFAWVMPRMQHGSAEREAAMRVAHKLVVSVPKAGLGAGVGGVI